METKPTSLRKSRIVHLTQAGSILLLAILLNGCCTPALWTERAYQPAADSSLSLARSPQSADVLVRYDECRVGHNAYQARAYWLFAYKALERDTNPLPRPDFVDPRALTNLVTIPVFTAPPTARQLATNDCYAVFAGQLWCFELWEHHSRIGQYRLPVHQTRWSTRARRAALTPVALAGDTAIVCGVAAAIAGVAAIMAF
jgi:hypothetical protein